MRALARTTAAQCFGTAFRGFGVDWDSLCGVFSTQPQCRFRRKAKMASPKPQSPTPSAGTPQPKELQLTLVTIYSKRQHVATSKPAILKYPEPHPSQDFVGYRIFSYLGFAFKEGRAPRRPPPGPPQELRRYWGFKSTGWFLKVLGQARVPFWTQLW